MSNDPNALARSNELSGMYHNGVEVAISIEPVVVGVEDDHCIPAFARTGREKIGGIPVPVRKNDQASGGRAQSCPFGHKQVDRVFMTSPSSGRSGKVDRIDKLQSPLDSTVSRSRATGPQSALSVPETAC